MPKALVNGVNLYYEIHGTGLPLILCHEFAGDYRSWDPQVKFFARRYQVVTYNARGYPPSDVPEDVSAYSQEIAAEDITGLMRALKTPRGHICGLSMGGYATLHFGLRHPEMALSLAVGGAGYGSVSADRERFKKDVEATAARMEREGMRVVAEEYSRGPTRVQLERKDPKGWQEFYDQLRGHSDKGSALTFRGVQMRRPSVYELEAQMRQLRVPALIMTGDEDEPCLEPSVFMKRCIPTAGLLVIPVSGHTINIEEPEAFNRGVLDFLTAVDAGRWPERDPRSVSASAILPGKTR